MMHSDNVVVAIQHNAKTLREYDHDRTQDTSSCGVVLPFDSEYSFLFKVLDTTRRRVVVSIDGIDAFDLILNSGTHVVERFGDSARKFKFVEATNPAVTDPTSAFNGRIQVKVCREKPVFFSTPWKQLDEWNMAPPTHWTHTKVYDPFAPNSPQYFTYTGINVGDIPNVMYCSTNAGNIETLGSGATIEGSESSQQFSSTHWLGDDMPYSFFNFTMRGKAKKAGHCTECGEKLQAAAKFCHHCGTRV